MRATGERLPGPAGSIEAPAGAEAVLAGPGPAVTPPGPPAPGPAPVAVRFEVACSTVLRDPLFEGVYLSPLWDLPAPEGILAWKRSVLRRRPGGGAEPWGHLFLVEETRPGAFTLKELHDAPEFLHLRPLPLEGPWGLESGPPPVWLLLRARDERTRAGLGSFAEALRAVWPRP